MHTMQIHFLKKWELSPTNAPQQESNFLSFLKKCVSYHKLRIMVVFERTLSIKYVFNTL